MSQTDNNDNDSRELLIISQILDSYFFLRSNEPLEGYFIESKTTQDIIGELQPMYPITEECLAFYMMERGYTTTTLLDGTVAWAIWRKMEPMT